MFVVFTVVFHNCTHLGIALGWWGLPSPELFKRFHSASSRESINSPRSPDFLSWRIVFKNQILSTGSAHFYGGVTASRFSQWTELVTMCMDNNSCIHVYISIFIYDSILYIFLKIPMCFIDNSNPAHHRYILTFNSIMICNLFLRQLRNISLIIYSIFTFLFNPSIHIISELLMHTPLRNEFTN